MHHKGSLCTALTGTKKIVWPAVYMVRKNSVGHDQTRTKHPTNTLSWKTSLFDQNSHHDYPGNKDLKLKHKKNGMRKQMYVDLNAFLFLQACQQGISHQCKRWHIYVSPDLILAHDMVLHQ